MNKATWTWMDEDYHQKGYTPVSTSQHSIKSLKGKRIVYLTKNDVSSARGLMFPRYGILDSVEYSTAILDNGTTFDIRDLIEIGVKSEDLQ